MNKKIGFILVLILLSVMMVGIASAGFFDSLGGGNNNNQTANDNNTFVVGLNQTSLLSDIKTQTETTQASTWT